MARLRGRLVYGALPFVGALLLIAWSEWGALQVTWGNQVWTPPRLLGIGEPRADMMLDADTSSTEVAANDLPPATPDTTPDPIAANADSVRLPVGSTADPGRASQRLTVSPGALDPFFGELARLAAGDNDIIRIAHFGDSQIEGDRFSMDLRADMQRRFGDAGLGWVPIVSEVARLRTTVQHTFGGDWSTQTRVERSGPRGGLGPAGFAWTPRSSTATVRYTLRSPHQTLVVGLGAADSATRMTVRFDSSAVTVDVPPRVSDTAVVIRPPTDRFVRADLSISGGAAVHGVWFSQTRGIAVDNFAMRGSNGIALTGVRACAVSRTPEVGRYRLVVLQYGLNVMTDQASSYDWYADRLRLSIRQLRRCFPGTGILVMGPSLRAVRSADGVRELRGVVPMTAALRALAIAEGAAFWDQSQAMREQRDVPGWVRSGQLADLTHYSGSAARKLAELLASDLNAAYATWRDASQSDTTALGSAPPT